MTAHQVTPIDENTLLVISGNSGQQYRVGVLADRVTLLCNCAKGRFSSKPCTHCDAVRSFLAGFAPKPEPPAPKPAARRQTKQERETARAIAERDAMRAKAPVTASLLDRVEAALGRWFDERTASESERRNHLVLELVCPRLQNLVDRGEEAPAGFQQDVLRALAPPFPARMERANRAADRYVVGR